MLQVGIVGLPNVGKSSLFNALTAAGVPSDNYPFCTVEPNVGIVAVPDERLSRIHALAGSKEAVPAFIQFVDIAGLVRGASEGEGLGNQFLGHIRGVDAVAHVLRCFDAPNVTHLMGSVDPVRDAEVVHTEMALADLETVGRRLERVAKKAHSGEKEAIVEETALGHLQETLARGQPLVSTELSSGERRVAQELGLLTVKPMLYVANIAEGGSGRGPCEGLNEVKEALEAAGLEGPVIPVSAAIEGELAELEPGERKLFLEELGMVEAGLERVIRAAYSLLGLITFFSTNENQTHAWTVHRGARAPEAAGAVHSDFQKGFIRAEAIGYEEFLRFGSMKSARDRGAVRIEGKDYVVQDGDILLFRFHV